MRLFRQIACLALLCACLLSVAAAPGVELRINSENGIFAKGDSVKIVAVVPSAADEHYLLQISSYGKTICMKEIFLPQGSHLVYADAFDRSISVMVNLAPASRPKQGESVGFIVAPEDLHPGFGIPADLRSYWDRELTDMRSYKPKVVKSPAVGVDEKDAAIIKCYKIEIPMPSGNPCRGYVAYPLNAAKKSLPIYIKFHAAGVNRPHVPARAKDVVAMAKKGCIALDINAHGILDDQPEEYYKALDEGELKDYSHRPFTGVRDYYFHNMYLRDVRAIDYATTLKCWDGKRIILQGGSQGGGQAMAVAGIDGRVSHVIAIYPAITDTGGSLEGRRPGWPASVNEKYAVTELGEAVMAYHDAAVLVSLFTGDLYLEAGPVDTVQDPAAVLAAYNNASSAHSRQIHLYPWCSHSGAPLWRKEDWKEKVLYYRDLFLAEALKR